MPWNLMRVEQRIGRIDRIGATYREIRVTNYFYADTVEQRVYEGIAGDYTDFTDIVGNAQPVLGTIEKTIEQLALADTTDQDTRTEDAVGEIKNDLTGLATRPVQTSDLGDTPEIIGHIDRPPTLSGSVTLTDLEATLTANRLTRDRFAPVDGRPGVYRLARPDDDYAPVSFRYTASPTRPSDYGANGPHRDDARDFPQGPRRYQPGRSLPCLPSAIPTLLHCCPHPKSKHRLNRRRSYRVLLVMRVLTLQRTYRSTNWCGPTHRWSCMLYE